MNQNKRHLSLSSYNCTLLYYHLPPGKCEIIWNTKEEKWPKCQGT